MHRLSDREENIHLDKKKKKTAALIRDETDSVNSKSIPSPGCEFKKGQNSTKDIIFLNKTLVNRQTNTDCAAIWVRRGGRKKKDNLEGKQAVPYGFQGLHLFFRVPLSGVERGESSGENGEP